MKNLLLSIAVVSLLLPCLAIASQGTSQSRSEPKYHYAFRHTGPDGEETMIMNWDGNINWDNHPNQDELWVKRDSKSYLITDKATLDAFQKDMQPLREAKSHKREMKESYFTARTQQREVARQDRSLSRQIDSLQRRLDRSTDASDKSDYERQIKDLRDQQSALSKQSEAADKQMDAAEKKRADFERHLDDVRAKVYPQIDKLIDQALKKGLGKEAVPG